jgi:hypothetical protein
MENLAVCEGYQRKALLKQQLRPVGEVDLRDLELSFNCAYKQKSRKSTT